MDAETVERVAQCLYRMDHGEWISGTPRTPWGTSRESALRSKYVGRAAEVLAVVAQAPLETSPRNLV